MTLTTKLLGLVAALAATAVLAGCGGDSGPSKAEFVKKADAACAQTNKAHPPPPAPKDAKAAAAQQGEEVTIRTELDEKLRDLEVPDAEKKNFDAYNAETTKIIGWIGQMKSAAEKDDQKAYGTAAAGFEKASAFREKIAVKLGFKTCGRKNPVE